MIWFCKFGKVPNETIKGFLFRRNNERRKWVQCCSTRPKQTPSKWANVQLPNNHSQRMKKLSCCLLCRVMLNFHHHWQKISSCIYGSKGDQKKCATEKKYTAMTRPELVQKIRQYRVECTPSIASIVATEKQSVISKKNTLLEKFRSKPSNWSCLGTLLVNFPEANWCPTRRWFSPPNSKES